MSPERFEHLLAMVAPFISKNDTAFRKCTSAAEGLVVTLQFFSTGDAQQSLSSTFVYVLHEIQLFWNFTPGSSANVRFLA